MPYINGVWHDEAGTTGTTDVLNGLMRDWHLRMLDTTGLLQAPTAQAAQAVTFGGFGAITATTIIEPTQEELRALSKYKLFPGSKVKATQTFTKQATKAGRRAYEAITKGNTYEVLNYVRQWEVMYIEVLDNKGRVFKLVEDKEASRVTTSKYPEWL